MSAKFKTPLVLVALATVSACVTSRPHGAARSSTASAPSTPSKARPLAKEGQKTPQPETAIAAAPVASTATKPDLMRTFNRLNDPTIQIMDEDIHAAMALQPASPGSLEEALVVLAQLRLLQIQAEQSSKFQSHDLYDSNPDKAAAGNDKPVSAGTTADATPAPSAGSQRTAGEAGNAAAHDAGSTKPAAMPSMEGQFRELNIDLVKSFNQNNHLKNLPTLALVKSLLEHTSNSQPFNSGMQAIIDAEAQKWAALQKSLKTESTPAPAQEGVPAPVETAAAPLPDAQPPAVTEVHTGPTDLKRSDAILMQSQRLADKGEFKQAIDQAARIEGRDPFFDQAKEKIKVYSNRAVQDLRQKAAQAFQNAMPVADSRAKAAYLKQARDLLEQALKDYPVADQLDTVRDNLAVITRDLSGIDKDGADNIEKTQ